jgi:hypothetical protein
MANELAGGEVDCAGDDRRSQYPASSALRAAIWCDQ